MGCFEAPAWDTIVGSAPLRAALVWVPGFGCTRHRYRALAQKFAQHGVVVVLMDRASLLRIPRQRALDRNVALVGKHLDRLRYTYETLPLFVGGHSIGATIAAEAAALRHDVRAVLLADGVASICSKRTRQRTETLEGSAFCIYAPPSPWNAFSNLRSVVRAWRAQGVDVVEVDVPDATHSAPLDHGWGHEAFATRLVAYVLERSLPLEV